MAVRPSNPFVFFPEYFTKKYFISFFGKYGDSICRSKNIPSTKCDQNKKFLSSFEIQPIVE